jgi:hypothetical protein
MMTANRILGSSTVLSIAGMIGLATTALVGFEEPNNTLLLVSTMLVLAAPTAALVHLSLTRELTRQEKRAWIRGFTGPRAPRLFADYLTSRDRRATARNLAEQRRTPQ